LGLLEAAVVLVEPLVVRVDVEPLDEAERTHEGQHVVGVENDFVDDRDDLVHRDLEGLGLDGELREDRDLHHVLLEPGRVQSFDGLELEFELEHSEELVDHQLDHERVDPTLLGDQLLPVVAEQELEQLGFEDPVRQLLARLDQHQLPLLLLHLVLHAHRRLLQYSLLRVVCDLTQVLRVQRKVFILVLRKTVHVRLALHRQ